MTYIDPKSGGDIFGASEVLTSAQANAIIGNQRHFALSQLLNQQPVSVTPGKITGVELFRWTSGGSTAYSWLAATGNSNTANVGLITGASPAFVNEAHGQTMTNISAIQSVGSRPFDRAWFGVTKAAATARGYLSWDGTTWSIHDRVYTTGVAATCVSIAYSPDEDTLVAGWDNSSIEYNTSGTTWTGVGNVDAEQVVWGTGGDSVGRFVGCLHQQTVSHVATSTDGQTWNSVEVGTTLAASVHLAHDYSAKKFYLAQGSMANAELEIYSSTNGQSWSAQPSVANPDVGGPGVLGFASYGGIWIVTSLYSVYVTPDEGVTWYSFPTQAKIADVYGTHTMTAIAGGRLFNAYATETPATSMTVTAPFIEPWPGQ